MLSDISFKKGERPAIQPSLVQCIYDTPITAKRLCVREKLYIHPQKPDAKELLETIVNVHIYDIRILKANKAMPSCSVIVQGQLYQQIEYIAENSSELKAIAFFSMPFSTQIALPESYVFNTPIKINPTVMDVYVHLLDKRIIMKNVSLSLCVHTYKTDFRINRDIDF